jgi:hypothetical protein
MDGDPQVFVEEAHRIGHVGRDASHLGGQQEYVFRPLVAEIPPRALGIGEVELPAGRRQHGRVALGPQPGREPSAHHARAAGDEDAGLTFHQRVSPRSGV